MVSMFISSVVDRGFEPWSGQTKDKKRAFVATKLSTQHLEERADWLARNQDNIFIRIL
jgi:hypothetical protein